MVGTFAVYPWLAGIGLLGILITAALFLHMLQEMFLGELPARWSGWTGLRPVEILALSSLLIFVVVIGVAPAWLLGVVDSAADTIVRNAGLVRVP